MNIVVAFNDTPHGHAAVDAGIAESKLRQATLHVLHVARVGVRNERPEVIAHYRRLMENLRERLAQDGVEGRAEVLLEPHEHGRVLLSVLRDLDADLLVVGSRHRSPVGKLVLGSTVQHLLLRADCPVLVVRAALKEG
ncbi:universal stress protein [Egicoccus sp. AB-alg2]|uniref:universal stress protein n=1 Tax=Egicoccus sp. AB-alg2 TaxID=3242693 RepID=UPI00359ED961